MSRADYIDRQATIDKINERQRKLIYCFGFENDAVKIMDIAKSIVTSIPPAQPELESADIVPVVHGEWLPTNDDNKKRCNKCDTIVLIAMYPTGNANYCPNCGAKMDAQGEE